MHPVVHEALSAGKQHCQKLDEVLLGVAPYLACSVFTSIRLQYGTEHDTS